MYSDIIQSIRNEEEQKENYLSKFATKSSLAIRKRDESKDLRLDFARDVDRIVHSSSYTRYIDKTQVYSSIDASDISKRITHVQFVCRASKTIARCLGLNEDLCEAISFGHDVGHVPFGHIGEDKLNELYNKRTGKYFAHNINSVRVLDVIEKGGIGLNLTLQVLDGIMCHNGEILKEKYAPISKTKNEFLEEYYSCIKDDKNIKKLIPMTLEGCVVRLSDVIGYIGKDIDDAKKLDVFDTKSIPSSVKKVLGVDNVSIMNNIITDVVCQSYGKGYIQMSPKVYEQLEILKRFNYENIYKKALSKDEENYISNMFSKLYDVYLNALENKKIENDIYKVFLNNMNEDYISNTSYDEIVVDYISSMTDGVMESQYKKYINKDK